MIFVQNCLPCRVHGRIHAISHFDIFRPRARHNSWRRSMSSAAGSAAPSAHAGADGVSRRDIAALVYNYLRSNGFAKVRPCPPRRRRRASPPRAPLRGAHLNQKKRAGSSLRPPLPTPPTTLPDSPLVIHAQAAKQFRTDADALLAPFRNRVPTGVVGLERIVGEYVAIRARDDARRLAMDANPLARRMYEQLDDYAMHGGAGGGVGGGGAAMRPGPGMTPSATAGGGRHSMAVRHPRASTAVRPILPAPTPEERERMAAAAAAAAAARADAAGPGPGSTAAARGTRPPPPPPRSKSPHKRKGPAPPRRNPRSPGRRDLTRTAAAAAHGLAHGRRTGGARVAAVRVTRGARGSANSGEIGRVHRRIHG